MPARLYLYGGSFNPLGTHHLAVIHALLKRIGSDDQLVVVPCGVRTDGKESVNDTDSNHRAAIIKMEVGNINDPRLRVDLSDLDRDKFERTWDTIKRYEQTGYEIWFIVGSDQIRDPRTGRRPIHDEWYRGQELFDTANFLVFDRPDYPLLEADLPPHYELMQRVHEGSSSEIRRRLFAHQDITGLVSPRAEHYLRRHHLHTGRPHMGPTLFEPKGPAILVCDDSRARAIELKTLVERAYAAHVEEPDHIIVIGGDGFMIDSLHKFAHLCLPFLGLNAGTTGFLLNDGTLKELEARLQARRLLVYQQPLLQARIEDQAGLVHDQSVVNEVFIERDTARGIFMRVTIDGVVRFGNLSGDGLMLATAAGSTGWSYYAGGEQITIGTPSLVLTGDKTGVNGLRWVTGRVPIHSTVVVELQNYGWRPAHVICDGEQLPDLVRKVAMRVSRAHAVELAFFPETDLSEKHMRRYFPG